MHVYLPPTSPVHAASVGSTLIRALALMSTYQVRPLTVHKLDNVQPVSLGVAGGNILAISIIYSTVVKTQRLCWVPHSWRNTPLYATQAMLAKANFRAQFIKMQNSGTKYAQAEKMARLLLILFRVLLLSNTCLMSVPYVSSEPTPTSRGSNEAVEEGSACTFSPVLVIFLLP